MSSTTDHVHEGRDQTSSPSTDAQVADGPLDAPRETEASFEEIERGRMNPSIKQSRTPEGLGRWGIRGMDDFTAEELARLQHKLDGWIRQRAHDPERTRRRPWVMRPKTAHPA